jgi:hypothetical protein
MVAVGGGCCGGSAAAGAGSVRDFVSDSWALPMRLGTTVATDSVAGSSFPVGAHETEEDRGSGFSTTAASLSDGGQTISALPVFRRLARHSAGTASSGRFAAGGTVAAAAVAEPGGGESDGLLAATVVAGCRPMLASLVFAVLAGAEAAGAAIAAFSGGDRGGPDFSLAISSSETDFSLRSIRAFVELFETFSTAVFSPGFDGGKPFTIGGEEGI